MNRRIYFLSLGAIAVAAQFMIPLNETALAAKSVSVSPTGIALPEGYQNWRILTSSHRTDNHSLRVILGNDVAMKAAKELKPGYVWPEGSIIAKLVWKEATHDKWPAAFIAGEFMQVEFMVKDAKKFAETGGWGFARWVGVEQKPFGENADFAKECFNCHTVVKDSDYVFTKPVMLP
jgi:hypothetical protein